MTETDSDRDLETYTFHQAVCPRKNCEVGVMTVRNTEAQADLDRKIHDNRTDNSHHPVVVEYEARSHGILPIPDDKPDTNEFMDMAGEK